MPSRTANILKLQVDSGNYESKMAKLRALTTSTGKANDGLAASARRVGAGYTKAGKSATAAGKQFAQANTRLAALSKTLRSVGGVAGFTGIAAVLYGVQRAFRAGLDHAIEFDKALVAVSKTTGLTGGGLEIFREQVLAMSSELGIARNEIAEIASIAGQLGVSGRTDLAAFTKVVAEITRASNLTAEAASLSLARLLKLTGTDIATGVRGVGDALINLGNNISARESEIAEVTEALARAFVQFKDRGVDAKDLLVFGAAVAQVGGNAAGAATAFGKLNRSIARIVEQGGPKLKEFARIVDKDVGEVIRQYQEDFEKLPEAVLKSLVGRNAVDTEKILSFFGVSDEKTAKNLVPSAGSIEENRRLVENSEGALRKESLAALSSTSGQFATAAKDLKNAFDDITRFLAETTLPAFQAFVFSLKAILKVLDGDLDTQFTDALGELSSISDASMRTQLTKVAESIQADPNATRAAKEQFLAALETAQSIDRDTAKAASARTGLGTSASTGITGQVIPGRAGEGLAEIEQGVTGFREVGDVVVLTPTEDLPSIIANINERMEKSVKLFNSQMGDLIEEAKVVEDVVAEVADEVDEAAAQLARLLANLTPSLGVAGSGMTQVGTAQAEQRRLAGLETARQEELEGLLGGVSRRGPGRIGAAQAGRIAAERAKEAAAQELTEKAAAAAASKNLLLAQIRDERHILKRAREGAKPRELAYLRRKADIEQQYREDMLSKDEEMRELARLRYEQAMEELRTPREEDNRALSDRISSAIVGAIQDGTSISDAWKG